MIYGKNISYSYDYSGVQPALNEITLSVSKGEFIAILGHNGCGKSTLAKHLNGLLELQSGELTVDGIDAGKEKDTWKLRRLVGMVFQNPDNQFVSSIVGEDVAFGLENYGTARNEIPEKVSAALKAAGMAGYEERSPHSLSGGQKQRVALAGVLALNPDILVFDEATAMLDPEGRSEVLAMIAKLHRQGKTIVMITHYVEEAVAADKVYLMHDGKMLACGTARDMLTDLELLARTGLTPPVCVKLYYDLRTSGVQLPFCPLTNEELVEELCRLK